jgi:predicted AAA+ superfamily ATPase
VKYLPRVVDSQLATLLEAMGGVLIEGPRACGKTATGSRLALSSLRFDASPELVRLAELDPVDLLRGPAPRLIDEWQLAPGIWNVIRHEIDARQAPGQFIISGSATPRPDKVRHSGAGRIARMRMRPMALAESGYSSGDVSLAALALGQDKVAGRGSLTYADLAREAVRGGWPGLTEASLGAAVRFNRSYCEDLTAVDVPHATGVRHEPVRLRRLLAALARALATEATLKTLAADVSADGQPSDPGTIRDYLDALTTVFAYEELPAWSVSLRSRSRLRTSPRIHLADPALALAALGTGADRLAHDPAYFGQVFEAMAVRDLRVYAGALDGAVYHYRDNTGLEVDAIVELPDWSWGAAEVKLGSVEVPKAEANLMKLRDQRVDTDKVGEPRFLAVITGAEYAYTLPSGVHVIPLSALSA